MCGSPEDHARAWLIKAWYHLSLFEYIAGVRCFGDASSEVVCLLISLYAVSQKKRHWCSTLNFNAHQLILVIFGRYVAERVCYQVVIYPTFPNKCFCTTWGNINVNPGRCVFTVMLYTVSRKRHCFGLLCLRRSSTILISFVDNKVVLLIHNRKH